MEEDQDVLVDKVQKLSLVEGDLLVVKLSFDGIQFAHASERLAHLARSFRENVPDGVAVILCPLDIDFTIIRKEKELDVKEAYANFVEVLEENS